MSKFRQALVLCLALFFTTEIFAKPKPILYDKDGKGVPESEVGSGRVNWETLNKKDHSQYNGIGLLMRKRADGKTGLCTGSLLENGGGDDAPAYVLTASHCYQNIEDLGMETGYDPKETPNLIKTEGEIEATFSLNRFSDVKEKWYNLAVEKVAYFTYHGVDVSVYRLKAKKKALKDLGYNFYSLSKKELKELSGLDAETVGLPMKNLDYKKQALIRSTCKTGRRVVDGLLVHGITHNCSSIGGISGSPLFEKKTGEIIGVHSTGNPYDDIEKFFFDDFTRDPGLTLANTVTSPRELGFCFDSKGIFNLDEANCKVEKPCDSNDALSCARNNCDRGNGLACWDAALIQYTDAKDKKDAALLDEVQKLTDKGCARENGPSCNYKGKLALKTLPSLGMEILKSGCEFGSADACSGLAYEIFSANKQNTLPPKFAGEKPVTYFAASCSMGLPGDCYNAATMFWNDYQTGLLPSEDEIQMVKYYAQSCFWSVGQGCGTLGYLYFKGIQLEPSTKHGLHFLEMGCEDLKDSMSCGILGDFYKTGEGDLDPSEEKAKEYYKKACDLGDQEACKLVSADPPA